MHAAAPAAAETGWPSPALERSCAGTEPQQKSAVPCSGPPTAAPARVPHHTPPFCVQRGRAEPQPGGAAVQRRHGAGAGGG